jgi:hypothetical protein
VAALPEYTIGGLSWQTAAQGTTDLIAAYLVDLANYSAWRITPYASLAGTTVAVRYADGVVVDNMDGVADVYVAAGIVVTKVPRYQKSVIPLARGVTSVVITGLGTPRVYFYAGTFHGQTDNVSFYSVQQMAAQSTITSGNIDAYLQTLRWKFNYQLASGSNLDNLTDSGFFDVLNPTSPASGNLPAGTWSITATSYSQSNLYTYQLARNILSPDTQVFERRQLAGSGWTAWRNVGLAVTGQCQFQSFSTTACRLMPLGGGLLLINGNVETVPATGVTLANTIGAAALAPLTFYYAFAYMSAAGVMSLEWSLTAYALDGRGNPIKAGDPTRTCVGIGFTDATGKFQDNEGFRGVGTYYNRGWRRAATNADGVVTASTALIPTKQVTAVSWGTDASHLNVFGSVTNSQTGNSCSLAAYMGGIYGNRCNISCILSGSYQEVSAELDLQVPIGAFAMAAGIAVGAGTGYYGALGIEGMILI